MYHRYRGSRPRQVQSVPSSRYLVPIKGGRSPYSDDSDIYLKIKRQGNTLPWPQNTTPLLVQLQQALGAILCFLFFFITPADG